MGASGFGYQLARQFGHTVLPTRAALVPLTLGGTHLSDYADLSGIALPVETRCNGPSFRAGLLLTHRGSSGAAILQISRSAERRGGKGGVSPCRSGWTPYL